MWARALILPPATLLKNRSMSHIVLPRTRTEPYCGMMTSVVCEGVMTRFSTHCLDKNDELTVDLSTAFDSLRLIVLINSSQCQTKPALHSTPTACRKFEPTTANCAYLDQVPRNTEQERAASAKWSQSTPWLDGSKSAPPR